MIEKSKTQDSNDSLNWKVVSVNDITGNKSQAEFLINVIYF